MIFCIGTSGSGHPNGERSPLLCGTGFCVLYLRNLTHNSFSISTALICVV